MLKNWHNLQLECDGGLFNGKKCSHAHIFIGKSLKDCQEQATEERWLLKKRVVDGKMEYICLCPECRIKFGRKVVSKKGQKFKFVDCDKQNVLMVKVIEDLTDRTKRKTVSYVIERYTLLVLKVLKGKDYRVKEIFNVEKSSEVNDNWSLTKTYQNEFGAY